MDDLIRFSQEQINKFPELKEEIKDLLQLCCDEIEAGESKENEIELCYGAIKDLIE